MSKIIYACTRRRLFDPPQAQRLAEVCKRLEPDNATQSAHSCVVVNERVAFAVSGDHRPLTENRSSVLLGILYDGSTTWHEPLADFPDGSFAIFRDRRDCLEVVSDAAASRTIWYYFDDETFVASTSQRAIVMFVGGFCFDERVIPWMISTGSLGPVLSWDTRLTRLPVDSSVILDKRAWSISTRQVPVRFVEKSRTDQEHEALLRDAIVSAVAPLGTLDWGTWRLPLSGGYDSRGLLCFLRGDGSSADNLTTVTWGLAKSLSEDGNDARIAAQLAAVLGVRHEYYHTDPSGEAIESVVNRFLLCSEGRIDHIAGYADGLALWAQLQREGVEGIIRGDEAFGWSPVGSQRAVRHAVGCALCSDYANLEDATNALGLPAQELPADLQASDGESLSAWRDRLYQTYRLPTILAALSDLKFAYVEQASPLLSRQVLNQVREMPDHLRTSKAAFKRIVDSVSPQVPYAVKGANVSPEQFLRTGPMSDLLTSTIRSDRAAGLLGPQLQRFVIQGMERPGLRVRASVPALKAAVKRAVPNALQGMLQRHAPLPVLDAYVMAFRVFIIVRMRQALAKESTALRR